MKLATIRIDKPDATNFILGQTHFIKSVEDIHGDLWSEPCRESILGSPSVTLPANAWCEAPATSWNAATGARGRRRTEAGLPGRRPRRLNLFLSRKRPPPRHPFLASRHYRPRLSAKSRRGPEGSRAPQESGANSARAPPWSQGRPPETGTILRRRATLRRGAARRRMCRLCAGLSH